MLGDARAAIERDDRVAAGKLLDAILRYDADHGMALLYRGQMARDRGDGEAALSDWRRVGDDPAKIGSTARYLEGTVALAQGRAREAERLFLRSAQLNPAYLQPHQRLLEMYVVQARRDDVRRQIQKVAGFRPLTLHEYVFRLVPPERANTPESGAKVTRSCFETDPDDVHSGLALGLYLIEGEQHTVAAGVLQEVLARHPRDVHGAALLAEAFVRSGQVEQAGAILRDFDANDQSPAQLWKAHGLLAEAKGDWQRAAACLARVIEAEPEDAASLYRLGIVKRKLGESDEAGRWLQRASLLDKMQREALRLVWGRREDAALIQPIIAEVARMLVELDYPLEAARWYEQALVLDPRDPKALAGMQRISQSIANEPQIASRPDPFRPRPVEPVEQVAAISQEKQPAAAVETGTHAPAATDTAIRLRDVHDEAGLDFVYFNGNTGFKHLVESMGGGIGVIDFDTDGRPDLYFPQGCSIPADPADFAHLDRLVRNRGDGTFIDVTEAAGIAENRYGQGITVDDYDSDGFADVAVANYGRNTLYRNNGDGTFADVTEAAGLAAAEEMSSSLAFADLDGDGHLDLYVTNYVTSLKACRGPDGTYNACSPTNFDAEQDRLYQSRGDGTFADVSQTSGVLAPDGKGLGVVVVDVDDDGRPDVYVANDTTPNFLFRNVSGPGDIQLVEEGLASGVALSGEGRAQAGMGIACADFNGDGLPDLHVTNFYQEPNTLYQNLGGGAFTDATRDAGLALPSFAMLGFGTQAADFDLDGRPDLFVANGHIDDFRFRGEPWKMPPQLYANVAAGGFRDVSEHVGSYFGGQYLGRGVAVLDYDDDGRPDLAVVHQDRPVGLLRNETAATGRPLVLELHGTASNRDAVGATVRVTAGGRTQRVDVTGGDGFFSSNEKRRCVGLGDAAQVDAVEIRWPSGSVERWETLPANVRLVCIEGRRPHVEPLASPGPTDDRSVRQAPREQARETNG